ncbi:MAG: 50S ribosomal protein L1 [Dehalococcoidia bacterium]|jgi:large subunit ribosomal protein L1|nr:50S ribosomal protein L1 [Dehalococcoidia bacterium]
MTKPSKRFATATALVESLELYSPTDAVELVKQGATAKFDETVEAHIRLNVDVRQADQQVRGVALLPHGIGGTVRILVFAAGEGERLAREAGADHVGADELIDQIEGGWAEFDVSLATPDMMTRITKLGRVLGRRGLMPNPRAGTVVEAQHLPNAIEEARKGRVEFRLDRTGIIHSRIGKSSFEPDQLQENLGALMDAVTRARPDTIRGVFIRSLSLSSTMGPGVRVNVAGATELAGNVE